MNLTPELKESIEVARQAMETDARHWINFGYRSAIYSAFGPCLKHGVFTDTSQSKAGLLRRVHLNKLSAQKVIFLWEPQAEYNRSPQEMLFLAEKVISGVLDHKAALAKDDEYWSKVSILGNIHDKWSKQEQWEHRIIFDVAVCALNTLRSSIYDIEYSEEIDYTLDEEASDPWSCESAPYAAEAYISVMFDSPDFSSKSFEFWTWWLDEAVPAAYNSVHD